MEVVAAADRSCEEYKDDAGTSHVGGATSCEAFGRPASFMPVWPVPVRFPLRGTVLTEASAEAIRVERAMFAGIPTGACDAA